MELLNTLTEIFIYLEVHLSEIIQNYGVWTYAPLFLVIIIKAGLIVTPFLSGGFFVVRCWYFFCLRIARSFSGVRSADNRTTNRLLCF